MACPRDDLALLMAWMEERMREKAIDGSVASPENCCRFGPTWTQA